jgi:hypothetical protein
MGYDVVDLLTGLAADCARLLDVGAAGLLLADVRGVLHVLASSSEQTRQLEIFQLQRDEGPCLDCYRTGVPVAVPDLELEQGTWPVFVPAAQAAGFASVHALPLRLREEVLGTMGLFGTVPGPLGEQDLLLGQALADVASVALVQDRIAADQDLLNEQLQTALGSRLVLEQAKGALAQAGGLDMTQAFASLRGYARGHNLRLTDVAQAIVDRTLASSYLLEYAGNHEPF